MHFDDPDLLRMSAFQKLNLANIISPNLPGSELQNHVLVAIFNFMKAEISSIIASDIVFKYKCPPFTAEYITE